MGTVRVIHRDGFAVIRCAPSIGRKLARSSAYFDREEGGWVLPLDRLPDAMEWLEVQGHTVIAPRPAGPRPLAPGQCPCGEPGCTRPVLPAEEQAAINQRGMEKVWAAWHRARPDARPPATDLAWLAHIGTPDDRNRPLSDAQWWAARQARREAGPDS